jgi:uncharacterized protein (TIGR02246 family)
MKRQEAMIEAVALLGRYAQAVDAGDADAIARLFAEDARVEGFVSRPVMEGRDEIRAFFAGRTPGPERHHVTSVDAELGDDGILRARSYLLVTGLDAPMIAVYSDELAERDGGWVFRNRVVRVET